MIQTLFNNWTAMRLIRLVLSIIIIAQAVSVHDTAMSFAGAILLLMAIANVGCCGSNGCATPAYKKVNSDKKEETISYEEVV